MQQQCSRQTGSASVLLAFIHSVPPQEPPAEEITSPLASTDGLLTGTSD